MALRGGDRKAVGGDRKATGSAAGSTAGRRGAATDSRSGTDRSVSEVMGQIERQFGKGAIMRLGAEQVARVQGVSTGCISLDVCLGGRGIPRDRITEIFGPESSGKTTLTLHAIANAQREGGVAAFIDAEHALDPTYARKLGVNLDQLLVSQPDTGEQALEITEMLIRSGSVDVVVIDSVAALVPRAEIEGEMGDSHVGLQARLMSQAMRKLTAALARSNAALIFINQIREKIGVMFGSPETTTGGRALKFYSSCRIDIRRIGALKSGDETIGMRARATVVKNKIAPPFRKTEFDILFDEGISYTGDLIDLGVQHGIIEKSGAWFSLGSERLGQGRERVREFLKTNPDIAQKIETDIRRKLNLAPDAGAAEPPADSAGAQRTDAKGSARAPQTATNPAAKKNGSESSAKARSAAGGKG